MLIEQDGTTAVLDVCGRRRVYRDTAGANNPATWTDVTLTLEDAQCPETTEEEATEPEQAADAPEQPSVLHVEPAPAPTEEPAPVEPAPAVEPAAPESAPAPAPAEEPAPAPTRRPRRAR